MNLWQHLLATALALFALVTTTNANAEKTIFLAPSPINSSLLNLTLESITPSSPKLRALLPVAFPTDPRPHGLVSWYLLRDLNPGQRHELRICWAATQPTDFWLDTFEIAELLSNPEIFPAVSENNISLEQLLKPASKEDQESVLLLRIHSAADFFTTDKERMRSPPPVDVDLILDPYLANIFPKSLLPTAGYIICLAIGSWFISGYIWTKLSSESNTSFKERTE